MKGISLLRSEAEPLVDVLESLDRKECYWADDVAAALRKSFGMVEKPQSVEVLYIKLPNQEELKKMLDDTCIGIDGDWLDSGQTILARELLKKLKGES